MNLREVQHSKGQINFYLPSFDVETVQSVVFVISSLSLPNPRAIPRRKRDLKEHLNELNTPDVLHELHNNPCCERILSLQVWLQFKWPEIRTQRLCLACVCALFILSYHICFCISVLKIWLCRGPIKVIYLLYTAKFQAPFLLFHLCLPQVLLLYKTQEFKSFGTN